MSQKLAASVPALLQFLPGEGGGRPGGWPALPFAAAQLSVGTTAASSLQISKRFCRPFFVVSCPQPRGFAGDEPTRGGYSCSFPAPEGSLGVLPPVLSTGAAASRAGIISAAPAGGLLSEFKSEGLGTLLPPAPDL